MIFKIYAFEEVEKKGKLTRESLQYNQFNNAAPKKTTNPFEAIGNN